MDIETESFAFQLCFKNVIVLVWYMMRQRYLVKFHQFRETILIQRFDFTLVIFISLIETLD